MIIIKLITTLIALLTVLMLHALETRGIMTTETADILLDLAQYSKLLSSVVFVGVLVMYRKDLVKILSYSFNKDEDLDYRGLPRLKDTPIEKRPEEHKVILKNVEKRPKDQKVTIKKVEKRDKANLFKDKIFLDETTIWIDKEK